MHRRARTHPRTHLDHLRVLASGGDVGVRLRGRDGGDALVCMEAAMAGSGQGGLALAGRRGSGGARGRASIPRTAATALPAQPRAPTWVRLPQRLHHHLGAVALHLNRALGRSAGQGRSARARVSGCKAARGARRRRRAAANPPHLVGEPVIASRGATSVAPILWSRGVCGRRDDTGEECWEARGAPRPAAACLHSSLSRRARACLLVNMAVNTAGVRRCEGFARAPLGLERRSDCFREFSRVA